MTTYDVSGGDSEMFDVNMDERCSQFDFWIESVFMGILILVGFVTNTVACGVLWQERSLTGPIFLIQSTIVADTVVLWMLFLSQSVPSLAYVITTLQNCDVICAHINTITRPLLFLAHSCSVYFVLFALRNRYAALCKSSTLSASTSDFNCAKKQAVATLIIALLFALPMTMDGVVGLHQFFASNTNTSDEMLIENKLYFTIYLRGVVLVLFVVLPLCLVCYYSVRLALVVQSARSLRRLLEPGFKMENLDMTQVLLAMGSTLALCHLPQLCLHVMQLLQEGDRHLQCGHLQMYLFGFTSLFVCINCSSKFFLLYIFGARFRGSLKRNFGKPTKRIVGQMAAQVRPPIYKCGDASEMTLMTTVESPTRELDFIFAEDE